MIDAKLNKALNRYSEIGGGKFIKIPEMMVRAQSKINVLEEELSEEMAKSKPNVEYIRNVKVRLVIAKREMDGIKLVKGS